MSFQIQFFTLFSIKSSKMYVCRWANKWQMFFSKSDSFYNGNNFLTFHKILKFSKTDYDAIICQELQPYANLRGQLS